MICLEKNGNYLFHKDYTKKINEKMLSKGAFYLNELSKNMFTLKSYLVMSFSKIALIAFKKHCKESTLISIIHGFLIVR